MQDPRSPSSNPLYLLVEEPILPRNLQAIWGEGMDSKHSQLPN